MSSRKLSRALGFYCFYPLLKGLSLLPMFLLYRVSDLLYVAALVIGYRRRVIDSNLCRAFPGEDPAWLANTRKKFYRHLCDLVVETLALGHWSTRRIQSRVKVLNPEILLRPLAEGKDVIAILGHYGNWEWVPVVTLMVDARVLSIYRPLNNQYFDNYLLNLRSCFGSVNVPMKNTFREVIKLQKQGKRFVLGLISDQSPANYELNYWTTFLGQPTPILLGPEKVAKISGALPVFWQMRKVRRGFYEINLVPYTGDVKNDPDHMLTEWHVRLLEKQIIEKPEHWLWSHNRWKYQHYLNMPGRRES